MKEKTVDFRDHSIITQVAFKGTVDLLVKDIDITTDEGQAVFERTFSYLAESLRAGIGVTAPDMQEEAAQVIQGAFPGTQALRIKGQQFGPIPDWAVAGAAAKGITEVYDNRDRAQGTKRPWFKSTDSKGTGLWPPDTFPNQ